MELGTQLKNAKIVLVGCGWLGQPLAKLLMQEGAQVSATTTRAEKKDKLQNIGIKDVWVGKLSPQWHGTDIHKMQTFDVVILNFPPGKASEEDLHVRQMQEIVKYIGTHTYVVYTSSTSVYPEHNKVVSEHDVLKVEDAAHKKIMKAEAYLRDCLGDRLTIARCGGLTGWDRNLAKYFSGKTDLEGQHMPVNLVHGEDAVRAIVHLVKMGLWGHVYNIVAPLHPSKGEFYSDLCQRYKLPMPQFKQTDKLSAYKIVSSAKLQNTGFVFKYEDPMTFDYKPEGCL